MKLRQVVLFVLMLVGLQLVVTPMRACFDDFPRPIHEYIDDADLVLVGTVTGTSNFLPGDADFTIQIESYFKGAGPDALLVGGFGNGDNCRDRVAVGERWIFFLDGNPESDEILLASYLIGYDAVASPTADALTAITEVTGQPAMPPHPTPFGKLLFYWTYTPLFKIGLLIGGIFVFLLIGAAISYARRNRRLQPKTG
jgi:hypothetical protein